MRSRRRGPTSKLIAVAVGAAMLSISCSTGSDGGGSSVDIEGADLFEPGQGDITTDELREHANGSVEGKTIAWVPVGLGVPLTDQWTHVIETRAEQLGMNYVLRDPNWDSQAEAQAVNALIAQKPDVLVVHNPDVQLLASHLQEAQEQGIYVIQVNMVSNFKSDAYIGADWPELGRTVAEDIVETCGPDTSGKVQIIEGPKTSGASLDQLAGAMEVFKQADHIEIVSDQSGGNWDPSVANELTRTVLSQHPDLCAIYGFWGVMTNGAAQAVKAAGKQDQVSIFTSGGGEPPTDCANLHDGLYDGYIYYNAPLQAQQVVDTANILLQSGLAPGTLHLSIHSPLQKWSPDNLDEVECFETGKTLP